MCGQKPTFNKSTPLLGVAIAALGLTAAPVSAQPMEGILEEIVVTATKREESLQEVPISVATLSGEPLNSLFSGSEDILALSGRVPGLYAESSNGRSAPRFYLRGLGNIDFDLAASQPVSIVMDEVVMENVVLKSFPLFDMQNIEVIRGPQGTLFGRNTTAGIIKINTRRPQDEVSGYLKGSWATYDTINAEGAVGGALIDGELSARISGLYRTRDNWITNGQTDDETLGDYNDYAARVQLLWEPNDRTSILLSHQDRSLDGTSSIFRANVFTTGSNSLNQNYDRETVWYDGGDDNPQEYNSHGTTINATFDFENFSLNSITSYQDAEGYSRGDIDGGVAIAGDFTDEEAAAIVPPGLTYDPDGPALFFGVFVPALTYPGHILIPSVTQDGAVTQQFTQEFRLASDSDGQFSWQVGAFYFDSDLVVTTDAFSSFGLFGGRQDAKVKQENETWAVFGQGSYDLTDELTLTAGVRYTDDQKDFKVEQQAQLWIDLDSVGVNQPVLDTPPISVDDDEWSWEVALNYALTDDSSLFGRVASGFRAQTIQGRDVAFGESPSVADPETIDSIEAGYKADLFSNRMRVNFAVFHYEVDDMQLSIIGGASNTNQVINADTGDATGFELDADVLITENLLLSFGTSYNDTEIQDGDLATAACGSGLCTVLDPLNADGQALLDGNPFPRAPKNTYNVSLRYSAPVGQDAEVYLFTDWAFYGEINMPLYEAVEFKTDNQKEGGLRVGYRNNSSGLEIAAFGRNITDEDNVLGYIDFSNNTGFVNEPRVWGLEVSYEFGD